MIECIYLYSALAFLSCVSFRNTTVALIEEIGISSRYYPKHYITPKRWIRNIFHIKKHKIPRYLYFELLLPLFFLALGPLNIVIYTAVDGDKFIGGMLVMFHSCLALINMIFIAIMTLLYKRKQLTSGCKKIYLDEIRLFQNAMTLSDPEAASGAKTAV